MSLFLRSQESDNRDERHMSSIVWRDGHIFHGNSVDGRGVYFHAKYGWTYAGQCKDGYACGLGVVTKLVGRRRRRFLVGWTKVYAEHGPDGQYDGRYLRRRADGDTFYILYERGGSELKDSAVVDAYGDCEYNGEACAPDDPRLLALIAQVAPVEVRPAALAPHPPLAPHSPTSNRPMDRPARFAPRRRWRRPWPPRCIPTPHAVAGRCATQPNQQSHCKARPCSDACTDRFAEVVTREALLNPNNRRLVRQKGPTFATPVGLTGRGGRGKDGGPRDGPGPRWCRRRQRERWQCRHRT
jgi:hypothetical protein